MPVQPSPSYHGYDVTDYFSVNPQFGDIALMKRFVQEAHRRGIRVIVDFVLNHCSSEHPLFREAVANPASRARQMFRFADIPEQLVGPWDQRAWHPVNHEFYYGVFSSEMPDWNFDDPAVTEHHQRAAAFWLKEIGVDGFRLDAVRYFIESGDELQDTEATRRWLKSFTEFCHGINPDSFVVSENTAHSPEVARTIRGGSVDSSFEFDLARATIDSVRFRTPGILKQTLQRLHTLYGDENPWSTLLTNHDQERARTQLGDNLAQTRFATKLLFTLPGVTFLYYGEELGMRAAKPDPELRTPMPWTPVAPNAGFTAPDVTPWKSPKPDFPEINVANEDVDPNSMLALYRQLVRLHQKSPALRHGKRLAVTTNRREVLDEARETPDEVVLVLANFSDVPIAAATIDLEKSAARSGWRFHEEMANAAAVAPEFNLTGGFKSWQPLPLLPPESVFVFSWRR
jgi:glycosidase